MLFGISIGFFYLLGKSFVNLIRGRERSGITYIALGIGIFSYLIYILGILGLFYKTTFQIILGGEIIIVIFWGIYLLRAKRTPGFKKNKNILNRYMIFLFLWIGFNFFNCFDKFIEVDSLAYHLYLPKLFLKFKGIRFLPFNGNSLFPMLNEMFYTYALSFNAISLSKMFHFLSFVLILGVVYYILKDFQIHQATFFTFLILVTIPGMVTNSVISYVDLTMALFSILSFYYFLKWKYTNYPFYFFLMGIFSGLAISVKHLGIFLIIILSIFLISESFFRRKQKMYFLRPWLTYLLVVFLSGGWWYLRAFLLTGNPFYPYLYQIFGPQGWHSDVSSSIGIGKGFARYLMGFWSLSIYPQRFGEGANQIGIIFLSFLPLLGYVWKELNFKEKNIIKWIGLFCFLYYSLWFFTVQNLRFLYPVSILLCIVTGVIIEKIIKQNRYFGQCIQMLYIFLIGINFLLSFYYQSKKIKRVFLDSPQETLRKISPTYDIAEWVNKNISHSAKILICGEPGLFYFEPKLIRESIFRYITQYHKKNFTSSQLYSLLKSYNFSYIILRKRYQQEESYKNSFLFNTIPYLLIEKKLKFVKFIHKEIFENKDLGNFEYVIYKIE